MTSPHRGALFWRPVCRSRRIGQQGAPLSAIDWLEQALTPNLSAPAAPPRSKRCHNRCAEPKRAKQTIPAEAEGGRITHPTADKIDAGQHGSVCPPHALVCRTMSGAAARSTA